MPAKRRPSSLGRQTSHAKCMRAARARASPDRSEEVRETNRLQQVICRARNRGDSRSRRTWLNAAFSYNPQENYSNYTKVTIGRMTKLCSFCQAQKWQGESPGLCCSSGKVRHLPRIAAPPEYLRNLLTEGTEEAKHFRQHRRKYNAAFHMTSFGVGKNATPQGYFSTFKVQGQVYHRMGSLRPLPGEKPKFVQLYFMSDDPEHEAETRISNLGGDLNEDVIMLLQEMLHAEHKYVRAFKYALESVDQHPQQQHKIVIHANKRPVGEHARRYNIQETNEVAVILVGEEHDRRDIIVQEKSGELHRIEETHRACDTLQYPLMFWAGQDGYNLYLKQRNPSTGEETTKSVSYREFYAYMFSVINDDFNTLLRFGPLTCQFVVDVAAKMETERLRYIRMNQTNLRAEQYKHLHDALNCDGGDPRQVGQRVILPSSFTGSPRYMAEKAHEGMCYVRKFGRPDLFITFTTNPKWEEIQRELFDGQTATDRPDIVARVFHEMQKRLLGLLKEGVFGQLNAWMTSIEWQKRGLPHSHTLIWCREKIRPDDVDKIISAELPDPDEDSGLFDVVKTQLIHGPCGAMNPSSPCMKEGKCPKGFPRDFQQATLTGEDGYPKYRRLKPEDGGFTTTLRVRGQEIEVDNHWVVPNCKLLTKIFRAHLNVEFCASVNGIKYICKYITKGSDMATFSVEGPAEQVDEIKQYQSGRYISSAEAMWRIFKFDVHQHYPAVVNLAVHLENGQRVYFQPEDATQRAAADPPETTLTAFFNLCSEDTFAEGLLYNEVPTYYTWVGKKWKRRVRGQAVEGGDDSIKADTAIGRVYTVHPNHGECFFLRMLLHVIKGPKSFESLRTYEGQVCATFREADSKRGLLEDEQHWMTTLDEVAIVQVPRQLRQLLAIMLTTCEIGDPLKLWEAHRDNLSEDYLREAQQQNPAIEVGFSDPIYNKALLDIQSRVEAMGGSMANCGMPQPVQSTHHELAQEILQEKNFNYQALTEMVEDNRPRLTPEQEHAFATIMANIHDDKGGIFFLDAPGGTGKTFLINLLLAEVRQYGHIALAVASSGITATLLEGGRTAHSALKLPLDLARKEHPLCSVSKQSARAHLLRQCKVIIWDEATMSHKKALEALDRTLQDFRDKTELMGGCTVVLSGDFRQILPVIPKGTRADQVNACLKNSVLWASVQKLELKTNMRVHLHGDATAETFAKQLLCVGDDKIQKDGNDEIQLPFGNVVTTEQELVNKVFPNIREHYHDAKWLCKRAILAPKNDTVTSVNAALLALIPGQERSFKSVHTPCDENPVVHFPAEFLNSLHPPGCPAHNLVLKIGAPIMLLRNLDPPRLCNGTRLVVKQMMSHVLEAKILTGKYAGEDVFIPRIPIRPSDLPFEFKRLQFPIRLAFAMSINKSQGQSLVVVGLNLQDQVFSHGQLYVGVSRVGNPNCLYILTKEGNGKTKNIVYPEVLQE